MAVDPDAIGVGEYVGEGTVGRLRCTTVLLVCANGKAMAVKINENSFIFSPSISLYTHASCFALFFILNNFS